MIGTDIVTIAEAQEWARLDYDETMLESLILIAYDTIGDSIDNFNMKLLSAKFRRKLKLLMLNFLVSAYDERGLIVDTKASKEEKAKYLNHTLLFQLQYGSYQESDT